MLYIYCFAYLFVNAHQKYAQPLNLFINTFNNNSVSNLTNSTIQEISIEKAISINMKADLDLEKQYVPKLCVLAADSLMNEAKNRALQDRKEPPFGLCEFPKSQGNNSILLIGNSYAGNQADMIYRHFENVSFSFKLFYMSTYDPLSDTNEYQDFRNAVKKIKPDILFVLHRSLGNSKHPLNGSMNNDTIYQFMLEQLTSFEKYTKNKVYIMNAFPSLVDYPQQVAINFLKTKHKPLKEIGDGLTVFDQEPARVRIAMLGAVCEKCEVLDGMRMMLDERGHFYPYDPHTSVMYFDSYVHFTDTGVDRLAPMYQLLARKFS